MIFRLELYERYIEGEELAKMEWWEDNMPAGSAYKPTYKYRRTSPRIDDIRRIIEIPGNKQECIVEFYDGQEMVVKGNYDDLQIQFNDMENSRLNFLDDELEDFK